jgi:hypothetical protein
MSFFESFSQPALLGGLLVIGVPVLIHLIMRQKPKHLLFPAMRFLLERQRSNQRKMKLRHLLLLALRMLLIALACLALARPKLRSDKFNITADRPRALVIVIDTSPSMEYKVAGKTRLDEARRLALELLNELPERSKVALLDTASAGGDWEAVASVRARISALEPQPANYPVTSQLAHAYDLFARLNQDQKDDRKALLPLLFVFSDRTEASWDRNQAQTLKRLSERVQPTVNATYVDVGVETAEDLAITNLELNRQILGLDEPLDVKATVRATNRAADAAVVLQVDGDIVERKPVKLDANTSQTITFEHRNNLKRGPNQIRVALEVSDAGLAFNDERFATVVVRRDRPVLIITDDPKQVDDWHRALKAAHFGSDADTDIKKLEEVADWGPQQFSDRYRAICLLHLSARGKEMHDLWDKLYKYVADGGGLAIVPGGEAITADVLKAYNDDANALKLMPAKLKGFTREDKQGVAWNWDTARYRHPVLAPFRAWFLDGYFEEYRNPVLGPKALRYWQVDPYPNISDTPVYYKDKETAPALVERVFDPSQNVRGRVLLFTVPLDDRHDGKIRIGRWVDYREGDPPFYFPLVKLTVGYLAGDAIEESFNFQCGQNVPIRLPEPPRFPTYTVQGPDESFVVPRAEELHELLVTKASKRGNYLVLGPDGQRIAGFSLNDAPEESLLSPRVPAEQIEALFGLESVLPVDYKMPLREVLDKRWSQPFELMPLLMVLLLLALAVENLLSNKFYRGESEEQGPPQQQTETTPGTDGTAGTPQKTPEGASPKAPEKKDEWWREAVEQTGHGS